MIDGEMAAAIERATDVKRKHRLAIDRVAAARAEAADAERAHALARDEAEGALDALDTLICDRADQSPDVSS